MGQYHYTVNLDKQEFLHPHKLGDGLKLAEQCNSHGGTMAALMMLLSNAAGRGGGDVVDRDTSEFVGRWAGDRIAVVGDYSEPGDIEGYPYIAQDVPLDHVYDACSEDGYEHQGEVVHFRDISEDMIPLLREMCDVAITGTGWRNKISIGGY